MTNRVLSDDNAYFTRSVVVYDGTEKKIRIQVVYYRKSLWIRDTMVSDVLTEGEDYVLEGTLSATAPGMYNGTIRGVGKYSGELPFEWELLSRDDPRILESPYAPYFLGEKRKEELQSVGLNPLNMDWEESCSLPNYDKLISDYEKSKMPRKKLMVHYSVFHMRATSHSYQDSFYPREACCIDLEEAEIFRAAVSDGVTSSYMSKVYADLVTERFCKSGKEFLHTTELSEIGQEWKDIVIQDAKDTYPNNPSMVKQELKLLRHKRASATLAGLELRPKSRSAIITTVGDSVVFEIMQDEEEGTILLNHTPNISWKEFTNRPNQLHSDDLLCPDEYIDTRFSMFSSLISENQIYFMICSDALAQYILSPQEDLDSNKFEELLAIKDNEEFEAYCKKQKEAGKLHDDDYTMCLIWVEYSYPQ